MQLEINGKKMKKHLQHSEKENSSLSVLGLDGNPFIEWITRHGETLLYVVLGAFIVLFGGYLWFAGSSTQAEGEFQNANEQFYVFQQGAETPPQAKQEALSKLTQLIVKQPDLSAKYDARVAQILIDRNEFKQAEPFAESSLERVSKDHIPFYVDYAQITLLIAASKFEEALTRSIALKEQMLKDMVQWGEGTKNHSFGEVLFAFNLLRIPFLQQQVGATAEELQSWNDWKSYMAPGIHSLPTAFNTKALFTVAQLFSDGSVSLDNYIDMRLQMLKPLQEKS